MGDAASEQDQVLAFMAERAAYDPPPESVERIETHASVVFLAGERAYKIKRAVKYPFLDFSTLDLRQRALTNELAINRRTAPDLYLDVMPIVRSGEGSFHLGGDGDVAEWALIMRRFDQEKLFDRMAEAGRLPLSTMPELAKAIGDLHAKANRSLAPAGWIANLDAVLRENESTLAGRAGMPAEALAFVNRASRERFKAAAALLRKRALGGYVRHCHGDLHLRNIVEIGGRPVLFDAIEFDDALATVDVLYDLAFLLMDLGARGLGAHANVLFNAYLDVTGDTGTLVGLAALPLFLATRALVRAKVESLRAEVGAPELQAETRARAASYVQLARDYLKRRKLLLLAIAGLSGSGKSSVARELARWLPPFPGAVLVHSDRERKRLFGVEAQERLPASAYTPEISQLVYRICRKRALMALEAGHSVIVDAVHARSDERDAIADVARRAGADFAGIWLEAPPAIMRDRIARRVSDVSDATPGVLDQQLSYDLGAQDFTVVQAGRSLDEVVTSCRQVVGTHGEG